KAEFLSHYYEGRLRPRAAYAMGLVYWWARVASPIAPLANAVAATRPFSSLLKAMGGVARQRQLPRLASPTFTKWFRGRNVTQRGTKRVLLWPDTFSNYFLTGAAKAAVQF